MFDSIFKGGTIIAGLAVGIGAVVLAPMLVPILRPLAKSAIKAGMMAYDEAAVALAELSETAGDIFAEVRSEMGTESNGAGQNGRSRATGRSRRSASHAS
jgi:Protein of unknown function (DUF5132)